MPENRDPAAPEVIRAWLATRAAQPLPDGVESRLLDGAWPRSTHPAHWRRAAAVMLTAALAAGLVFGLIAIHDHATTPGGSTSPLPPFGQGPLGCAPRATPAPTPAGIDVYKVSGLDGIGPIVAGPQGDLWFIGGRLVDPNAGDQEVVGRITPSGAITLYHPPGNPGWSFAGITAGPDGNVWFTEGADLKIARLVPATGRIDTFPVSLPTVPGGTQASNTQLTDIVAGRDGNLWFDVQQVSPAAVADGYVGRITPIGDATVFDIPGGGQPSEIQVGADGNTWSRIVGSGSGSACSLPGYSPTSGVVRVTPAGQVTLLSETSPQFAGYVVGPGGIHWWMLSSGVMRLTTPSGQVSDFPADTSLGFWDPAHFVFDRSGNAWYVDGLNLRRMTPDGQVTAYGPPGSNSGASAITAGSDGRIWFVEGDSGAATIGAIGPPAG